MRIGINLLYLIPGIVGGMEIYAAGLLYGLAAINRQDQFVVFVNKEAANWPLPERVDFKRVVCPLKAVNRLKRYFFEQTWLPSMINKYRLDVIHSLGYVGPLLSPCPSVVTLPDLNYFALKNTFPIGKRFFLRFFSTQAVKKASHVITISHFSKREICRVLKLNPQRVCVTYLGPKMNKSASADWHSLKQAYRLEEPYVAAFGGGALHKNIHRLLQAFARVANEFHQKLVLVGNIPANVDLSESTNSAINDRIILTGYIPEEHILPLLSHADLFVLPSLYEGFGLPIVEAQQAGVAIACSAAGSLPEVAGNGAVFFNPLSVDNIAQTIHRCLLDADLRARLRQLGSENVKRFSWEKTARETLAVYKGVYPVCVF